MNFRVIMVCYLRNLALLIHLVRCQMFTYVALFCTLDTVQDFLCELDITTYASIGKKRFLPYRQMYQNYQQKLGTILENKIFKNQVFQIQHSPAPTLPRVTLYSQLRYFELGPQNPELSYFCSFPPQLRYFETNLIGMLLFLSLCIFFSIFSALCTFLLFYLLHSTTYL